MSTLRHRTTARNTAQIRKIQRLFKRWRPPRASFAAYDDHVIAIFDDGGQMIVDDCEPGVARLIAGIFNILSDV